MAVGVSSNLPAQTSPIAYMLGTEVLSSSPAIILPLEAVLTPTVSRLSSLVSADLPMANRTVSYSSSISSSPCLYLTIFLPSLVS